MSTERQSNSPEQPLRSVYTQGLPEIFAQLNISLVVSTYQAGKVILVRSDGGAAANGHGPERTLNTHFRTFHKPMGIAVQGNKLTIGGQKTVWELHNMPALAETPLAEVV